VHGHGAGEGSRASHCPRNPDSYDLVYAGPASEELIVRRYGKVHKREIEREIYWTKRKQALRARDIENAIAAQETDRAERIRRDLANWIAWLNEPELMASKRSK